MGNGLSLTVSTRGKSTQQGQDTDGKDFTLAEQRGVLGGGNESWLSVPWEKKVTAIEELRRG